MKSERKISLMITVTYKKNRIILKLIGFFLKILKVLADLRRESICKLSRKVFGDFEDNKYT